MSNLGGKPLIYSSDDENRNQRLFLSGFFSFLFLFFLGIGIFLGLRSSEWWPMYFLGPIALLLGLLAFGFFPRGEDSFYRMTVYDGYLEQEWKKKGDPEIYRRRLLFNEVEECLIGIVSRPVASAGGGELFRYHGLVLLVGAGGVFRQEVLTAGELYEWRRRLFDKVGSVRYALVDLGDLLDSEGDLASVPSSEDNVISEFVGLERERPFTFGDVK